MDRADRLDELASDYRTGPNRPTLSYTVGTGWLLVDDWTVEVDNCRVDIPAGFNFDLASVPRPFWGLIAPFDLSIEAPLLHDFLYRNHQAGGRTWKRRQVDRLFRLVQKHEGVCCWRRSLSWLAVRLCGWVAWSSSPRLR